MSDPNSFERIFSLPSFEGLRLFRKYKLEHPTLPTDDLIELIENVEADAHNLDMESSAFLSQIVGMDCPLEGREFYQECIKAVLLKHRPIWAKLMFQGRRRFLGKLNSNDQDIFHAAGLMESSPSRYVVTWWDTISGYARLYTDQEKLERGREAEILSLEFERARLKKLGIMRDPEWPGLEDNYAGYDVLSYEFGTDGNIINKLIEVKSTMLSPLRFILTRHEWITAEMAGPAYTFHIWDMNQTPPILHIRDHSDITPHIPEDKGKGKWRNTEVPVSSAKVRSNPTS